MGFLNDAVKSSFLTELRTKFPSPPGSVEGLMLTAKAVEESYDPPMPQWEEEYPDLPSSFSVATGLHPLEAIALLTTVTTIPYPLVSQAFSVIACANMPIGVSRVPDRETTALLIATWLQAILPHVTITDPGVQEVFSLLLRGYNMDEKSIGKILIPMSEAVAITNSRYEERVVQWENFLMSGQNPEIIVQAYANIPAGVVTWAANNTAHHIMRLAFSLAQHHRPTHEPLRRAIEAVFPTMGLIQNERTDHKNVDPFTLAEEYAVRILPNLLTVCKAFTEVPTEEVTPELSE